MVFHEILLFAAIALGVVAHLSLKKGMQKRITFKRRAIIRSLLKIYLNPFVILGALAFGASIVLFTIALSGIDLSYAYPLGSLSFVLVSLFSKFIFKEKVTKLRWFSIGIITFGVILISLS